MLLGPPPPLLPLPPHCVCLSCATNACSPPAGLDCLLFLAWVQASSPDLVAEQTRETEAALSLLANMLKAEPVLGLELVQIPVPGASDMDLPSLLAAAINLLCSLPHAPGHLIGDCRIQITPEGMPIMFAWLTLHCCMVSQST